MSLIEVDAPTAAEAIAERPVPFLVPTLPPPGRIVADSLPVEGAWVKIISGEGSFVGRVLFAEPDRIRIKEGAGFWDIATAGILSIQPAEHPSRRSAAEIADRERRRNERLVQRVLSRWP
jgi:hypothetical protein